jgi:hypothetical protein
MTNDTDISINPEILQAELHFRFYGETQVSRTLLELSLERTINEIQDHFAYLDCWFEHDNKPDFTLYPFFTPLRIETLTTFQPFDLKVYQTEMLITSEKPTQGSWATLPPHHLLAQAYREQFVVRFSFGYRYTAEQSYDDVCALLKNILQNTVIPDVHLLSIQEDGVLPFETPQYLPASSEYTRHQPVHCEIPKKYPTINVHKSAWLSEDSQIAQACMEQLMLGAGDVKTAPLIIANEGEAIMSDSLPTADGVTQFGTVCVVDPATEYPCLYANELGHPIWVLSFGRTQDQRGEETNALWVKRVIKLPLIEDSQTLHTSYLHYPVSSWFGDVRGDVLTFILSHSHCENVRAFFLHGLVFERYVNASGEVWYEHLFFEESVENTGNPLLFRGSLAQVYEYIDEIESMPSCDMDEAAEIAMKLGCFPSDRDEDRTTSPLRD